MKEKHRDNILKLRSEGFTYNQIVEKLGCVKTSQLQCYKNSRIISIFVTKHKTRIGVLFNHMFITNSNKSYIGYKDLINNTVLVFDVEANAVEDTHVRCNDWHVINLFEVPVKVLQHIVNSK